MNGFTCSLCFLDAQLIDPPRHEHFNGDIPLTPCALCLVQQHDLCDPVRFFCTCACGLKEP